MPDRKFNLTVRELPPFLDGRRETTPRRLIDDFAGFAASRVEGQRKCLSRLLAGHPACQLIGANEHVGTPKLVNADGHEHQIVKRKYGQSSGRFVPAVHWGDQSTNGVIGAGIVSLGWSQFKTGSGSV
jgi:hypothetical protein